MIHKTLSYEQNNHAPYTLIKCDILQDNSLSFGAKGIFCYLVSKFSGWTTRIANLTNHATNGAFSTRKMLAELKQTNIYPLINTYRSERKEQYNGVPYVKIDNDLLNNLHLSWQEKCLLIYLLSKPKEWKVCLSHLVLDIPKSYRMSEINIQILNVVKKELSSIATFNKVAFFIVEKR